MELHEPTCLPGEQSLPPLELALPWSVAGGGALVAIAGAVTAVIGAQPWLRYSEAFDAHGALDPTSDGYPALAAEGWQEVQVAADEWEAWGAPAFLTGVSLTVVGVAAAAIGASWGTLLLLRDPGEVVEE